MPKKVLEKIFIQPNGSKKSGYDEIMTEVISLPDGNVIQEIEKCVVSVNEDFVSSQIKNATGFILFVEYGKISADHNITNGIVQSLAVSVAYNFSNNNNGSLNEILQGILWEEYCYSTFEKIYMN